MRKRSDEDPSSFEALKLRNDLAAIRFQTALVRLELKYREDQPRVPKGQHGGGQFAKEVQAFFDALKKLAFVGVPPAVATASKVAGAAARGAAILPLAEAAPVAAAGAATQRRASQAGDRRL